MKIVLLYLGKKGAGPMYAYEFTKALLDKKIEILVFISTYIENIELWNNLEYSYNNIKIIKVNTFNNIKEFIINSFKLNIYYKIIKETCSFNPNLILMPMIHPWHNIIINFIPKKIKKVKVIHDAKVHKGEDNIFNKLLSWIDIKLSDELIVLSEFSKNQLQQRIGNKRKIVVIPHANFSIYNNINTTSTASTDLYYKIGFFGRINKYKGLDVLLKAFCMLVKESKKYKLLIAGNGEISNYLNDFQKLENNLELNIKWIADEEIASLINKVDVVVLPYTEASQSGVIPLAFSLGKPVIASNVGGIPEQVPTNTGILVPPNDPNALLNAIKDMYKNPTKMHVMGNYAKKYAIDFLSWESSANIFVNEIIINN